MQTTKAGRTEHTSGIRFSNIVYNDRLSDELFTTVQMKKGLNFSIQD
jgi:hypothetical protein